MKEKNSGTHHQLSFDMVLFYGSTNPAMAPLLLRRLLLPFAAVLSLLTPLLRGQTTVPTDAGALRVTLTDDAPAITLQLHRAGALPLARGKLNGQDAGWFIIDTGASGIFLERDIARKLGLQSIGSTRSHAVGGMVDAEVARADRFELGGLTVHQPILLTADTRTIRNIMGAEVAGFVGGDVLASLPFTLDLRDDTLTFHRRRGFAPPATQPIDIRTPRSIPAILASLEGRSGWFLIDTGANGELHVSGAFLAYARDLLDGRRIMPSLSVGAGGKQDTFDVRFASLLAMGRSFEDVEASYALTNEEMDFRQVMPAGWIGLGMLRDARLTFDYLGKQLWAQWRDKLDTEGFITQAKRRAGISLSGETPLMLAAGRGRADAVAALLAGGADVNAVNSTGFTALIMAADEHDQCLRLLIDAGADVNVQAAVMGLSALHYAASNGRIKSVKALLSAKANVNVTTTLGQTPLIRAAEGQWLDVATALLDAGADLKLAKKTGETPLMLAAANGDMPMATLLLDRGADVNQMTSARATVLVFAARERKPEMVRLLLSRGAAASMPYAPSTPLHMAAQAGDAESAALLLRAGADSAAKDREGKTPLDRATSLGRTEVLRVLLDAAPTTRSSP